MKSLVLSLFVLVFSTRLYADIPDALLKTHLNEGVFTKLVNGAAQHTGSDDSCQIEVEGNKIRFLNQHAELEADFTDYKVSVLRDPKFVKQTSYTYTINSINLDSEFAQKICGVEKIAVYEQNVVKTNDTLIINDKAVCSDGQTFLISEACLIKNLGK